jgi:hypothetical protein
MRRPEAKRLVKPVRVGPALVRGQLDQTATAVAALCNRPIQHRAANAAASLTRGDAQALIWPRHMPRRVRPGMNLSCRQPLGRRVRRPREAGWGRDRSPQRHRDSRHPSPARGSRARGQAGRQRAAPQCFPNRPVWRGGRRQGLTGLVPGTYVLKIIPDYALTSANLRRRYGIGEVRTAT